MRGPLQPSLHLTKSYHVMGGGGEKPYPDPKRKDKKILVTSSEVLPSQYGIEASFRSLNVMRCQQIWLGVG